MSADLKFQALELAVRSGPNATAEGIVKTAEAFFAFLNGAASAGKQTQTKAVKDTTTDTQAPKTEAKPETPNEPATISQELIKQAVIALVNAGNKAAGNDKAGREHAGAVLAPFGAKNVSTIKPEDYAKVLEALQAKQKAIEDEAALTG